MITDLNKIIAEWSFRTKSGILDAKSMSHQIILEGLLKEYGWPLEARFELVNNLMEVKPDLEREKLMKQKIKYKAKDKEGKLVDKEITVGGALKQGEEHPAYEKAKQLTSDDDNTKTKGQNIFTGDPKDAERELGDDGAAEKERKKQEKLAQKKKENEQFGKAFDKKRTKVIDNLKDDDGNPIPSARTQKLKDYQNTTLKYLKSGIDDDIRASGMKGKQISEETHTAHVKCANILEKLWAGEKVSPEEQDHLSKWVAVVEPAESSPNAWKMYIAREPGVDKNGNFNRLKGMPADKLGGKHGSGESSADKSMQKWMQSQGVRTVRTSTYAGKLTTANQIFSEKGKVKKLKKIDPEKSIKRNKDKKVESVKLANGLTLTRVPKQKNETSTQRKKRQQNNAQLEEYGTLIEKGELEFIDMDSGANPDTPENRKQIIQEGLQGLSTRLRSLGRRPIAGVPLGDTNPPTPDPLAEKIIDRIEALSKKNPNENSEEWKKELDSIMKDLGTHETLGRSFANVAEIYSAIKTMHGNGKGTEAGSAAYLPESTTLETVDVLVVTENGKGKNKIVTIDGKSIKKGAGGASQLTAKVRKSGFKKVGNLNPEQVREKTVALSKKHEGIYKNDEVFNQNPPNKKNVKEELNHQQNTQNEIKESAKELGVDPKYIEYIERKMNDGKPSQIDSALKKIMAQRKQKGLSVDSDTENMMRKRMESYYLYQAMSHRSYNQNVEIQYFGNDSFSVKAAGIKVDTSDGVERIAWPKFEFNLGFSVTGRSTNAGGGRFVNSDADDPAYNKFFKKD